MMKRDNPRPVTLEDILRLKRAERPPAEFWTQFDRELRAKQLAALVHQRPWWRTISFTRVLAGLRRFHVPLGAAAVLAVTIFSVREYRAPQSAPVSAPAAAESVAAALSENTAVATVSSSFAFTPTAPSGHAADDMVSAESVGSPAATTPAVHAMGGNSVAQSESALSSDTTPAGGLVEMIPTVGATSTSEPQAVSAVGSRLMADSFVALPADDARLSRQLLTPPRGFETRALPASTKPVEPLAMMKVPSGSSSRRANLVTSATLATTTGPVLVSDRSARGLSDERLYDTVSRVNARGAGVAVKF
jgi:negative regulator of sigma E activity